MYAIDKIYKHPLDNLKAFYTNVYGGLEEAVVYGGAYSMNNIIPRKSTIDRYVKKIESKMNKNTRSKNRKFSLVNKIPPHAFGKILKKNTGLLIKYDLRNKIEISIGGIKNKIVGNWGMKQSEVNEILQTDKGRKIQQPTSLSIRKDPLINLLEFFSKVYSVDPSEYVGDDNPKYIFDKKYEYTKPKYEKEPRVANTLVIRYNYDHTIRLI